MNLTNKQIELVNHIKKNGSQPISKIAEALGVKSKNAVMKRLNSLVKRGVVKKLEKNHCKNCGGVRTIYTLN